MASPFLDPGNQDSGFRFGSGFSILSSTLGGTPARPARGGLVLTKGIAERREHRRVETEVQLQVTPEDGGVVARLVASNISKGGLFCTSPSDFPEMTRLAVRLVLPDDQRPGNGPEEVDVEAVVVRRREVASVSGEPRYELGLFFTKVDDGARDTILRLIE